MKKSVNWMVLKPDLKIGRWKTNGVFCKWWTIEQKNHNMYSNNRKVYFVQSGTAHLPQIRPKKYCNIQSTSFRIKSKE